MIYDIQVKITELIKNIVCLQNQIIFNLYVTLRDRPVHLYIA